MDINILWPGPSVTELFLKPSPQYFDGQPLWWIAGDLMLLIRPEPVTPSPLPWLWTVPSSSALETHSSDPADFYRSPSSHRTQICICCEADKNKTWAMMKEEPSRSRWGWCSAVVHQWWITLELECRSGKIDCSAHQWHTEANKLSLEITPVSASKYSQTY